MASNASASAADLKKVMGLRVVGVGMQASGKRRVTILIGATAASARVARTGWSWRFRARFARRKSGELLPHFCGTALRAAGLLRAVANEHFGIAGAGLAVEFVNRHEGILAEGDLN